MHGQAKRWISHLKGEGFSGELKGSGEGHNHTHVLLWEQEGTQMDFKKTYKGKRLFSHLKLYQIPPSLASVNLPAFLEIIVLWRMQLYIMATYDKFTQNYVIFKDRIKAITAVQKHFSITSNNVFHIFPFEK